MSYIDLLMRNIERAGDACTRLTSETDCLQSVQDTVNHQNTQPNMTFMLFFFIKYEYFYNTFRLQHTSSLNTIIEAIKSHLSVYINSRHKAIIASFGRLKTFLNIHIFLYILAGFIKQNKEKCLNSE